MSYLDTILARTRADLADRKARLPLTELQARCRDLGRPRDFGAAVRRRTGAPRRRGTMRVIAEAKKASPSRGVIREAFDAAELAKAYAAAGASAISVLTDAPFFHGSLDDLRAVRQSVDLPVLRKDFHIDGYQLWEARRAGADAVLLIAAALDDPLLAELIGLSRTLGLTALVEVHDRVELARALAQGATLIGVNNRDLTTFQVTLETTFRLLPEVPAEVTLVSESGIADPGQVARLAAAGVDAILVGEGLLKHADVGAALSRLLEPA
jgi:indole-3-glycerol phosphate synthase